MSLDILIFAGVAIFLLFRLKDILGRDEGSSKLDHPFQTLRDKKDRDAEQDRQDTDYAARQADGRGDNVVPLNTKSAPKLHEDEAINATLNDIRKLDPSFHPDDFLGGAEAAYEMVLNGFASGDLETLRGLMNKAVFEDFKAEIERRADAGETLETTLVGFDEIKITGASLEDKTAEIQVQYTSQQVNVLKDADGETLSEEEPSVETQTDQWTLIRKMTSKDPNWTLVALAEVEE